MRFVLWLLLTAISAFMPYVMSGSHSVVLGITAGAICGAFWSPVLLAGRHD